MPATDALIGHGLVFEIADPATPSVFTYIAEVFDVNPPSSDIAEVDATHMQSPNRTREFIAGIEDPGEMSFSMNYVPGSASDLKLLAIRGITQICRLTHKTGHQVQWNGFLRSYVKSAPTDDRMTAEVTFRVSGDPSQSGVTAPRSVVAPAVSGVETVGFVLSADPGVWAGAESIAFQWQNDGGTGTWADIVGATSQTYVLQSTDAGDDIRVEVTATNSGFSTVANSPETTAIS